MPDPRLRNTDPFEPWNDPMIRNDPFAPHNDPMKRNDPFAPWNDPVGKVEDCDPQDRDYYEDQR